MHDNGLRSSGGRNNYRSTDSACIFHCTRRFDDGVFIDETVRDDACSVNSVLHDGRRGENAQRNNDRRG